MAWFQVLSHTPIVMDHGNGSVQSLHRGIKFEADENNPDVRKFLTRSRPPKICVCAPDPDGIALPAASYPIPGPAVPEPPKKLPPGVSEVVRGPGLRGDKK